MKHLTDVETLSDKNLADLLTQSLAYDAMLQRKERPESMLAGLLQFNLFYENSTRTSLSFEVAGKRLGADVVAVPVAASSVHKGESLRDTVLTLAAQGADLMVLRATGAGTIDTVRSAFEECGMATALINGGEGAFGHPTQALLDAATLLKAFRREPSASALSGVVVTIIGDLIHSRVAASSGPLLARLGAEVRLCAPRALLPAELPTGITMATTNRDEALDGADVAMALRLQTERFEANLSVDPATYRQDYGLTMEALSWTKPGAFIMHPGPMNRGIEIDSDVADDPARSLILAQVAMGVPTRMAVLRFAAEK
ncbi:MAG: aspartate carbamoyltransferase catalytic subunit [Pseudomonadota bacterium]